MSFDVTPLGCVSGMPKNGFAGSGYLVSKDGFNLLIDAGCGVALSLSQHISPAELDAVIITHLHIDHVYDVLAVAKGIQSPHLTIKDGELTLEDFEKVPLLVPQGGKERFDAQAALFPTVSNDIFDNALKNSVDIIEYESGSHHSFGPFEIDLIELAHVVTDCGVRVSDGDSTFAFTGDTGVTDALDDLARDVDLFLSECTFPKPMDTAHGHMSAIEAATVAKRAGAKNLMLTHFGSADDNVIKNNERIATETFEKQVSAVVPGTSFTVKAGD